MSLIQRIKALDRYLSITRTVKRSQFDMPTSSLSNISNPAIIILAAGQSSRLGRPKQLLEVDGETLLSKTVNAALGIEHIPVFVVVGAHAERLMPLLDDQRLTVVHNPDWPEGMASSVRCGLTVTTNRFPRTDGVVIIVCDQPRLDTPTLKRLIELQRSSGMPVAAASYAGRLGTPAIFHASLFPELMKLSGDRGARQLLKEQGSSVAILDFEDGALDIDTEEDYQRWISDSGNVKD
jgi:molybdenum cofactor cytidylyltransferase